MERSQKTKADTNFPALEVAKFQRTSVLRLLKALNRFNSEITYGRTKPLEDAIEYLYSYLMEVLKCWDESIARIEELLK